MHQGIKFKFVGTQHASQTQAPKRRQRMEIKGVVKRWIEKDPPKVVNGLKVVTDKPKKRLCISPMYINAHMRYEPVRYEKLTDLSDMIEQGDYLTTSDDKSGY
ncbi:hypothetical protein WJX77_010255 [Trebouxia sp. C0004]